MFVHVEIIVRKSNNDGKSKRSKDVIKKQVVLISAFFKYTEVNLFMRNSMNACAFNSSNGQTGNLCTPNKSNVVSENFVLSYLSFQLNNTEGSGILFVGYLILVNQNFGQIKLDTSIQTKHHFGRILTEAL